MAELDSKTQRALERLGSYEMPENRSPDLIAVLGATSEALCYELAALRAELGLLKDQIDRIVPQTTATRSG